MALLRELTALPAPTGSGGKREMNGGVNGSKKRKETGKEGKWIIDGRCLTFLQVLTTLQCVTGS